MEGKRKEKTEKKEPKVINKGEAALDPTERLRRFIYIGNDTNVYINQRCVPISLANVNIRLKCIDDLAASNYNEPFHIIKEVTVIFIIFGFIFFHSKCRY